MDANDTSWLKNRIHAAVDDDFYLDRDEEKRIKEEAASRGIAIGDIELSIREELQKTSSVSERQLLDDLERLLHQFTDDDKFLDKKEERNAFDQVVRPSSGKRKGLDPRVAEEYVTSFCRVNGIKRQTEGKNAIGAIPIAAAVLLILVLSAVLWFRPGTIPSIPRQFPINQNDKDEIDSHIERAKEFVDRAQYTEPPERSAKAELDAIRQEDPESTYRKDDVEQIKHAIVNHYLALAKESVHAGNKNAAAQWLARAKLLGVDNEQIDETGRELSLR